MAEDKTQGQRKADDEKSEPAEKPASLHPLQFEDAVKGLLKAKRRSAAGKGAD